MQMVIGYFENASFLSKANYKLLKNEKDKVSKIVVVCCYFENASFLSKVNYKLLKNEKDKVSKIVVI